jgi:hypothetical protein
MIRWIASLSVLLMLGGCVTTREVVYRDGYSSSRYYDEDGRFYDDTRYERRDGSYYSPSYAGSGDYYYGRSYDTYSTWYLDYPAYYSVFWPLHRSWYDPYWYPNYYYGVTYFPRNYLSFSVGSRWGSPYYSSWYYSPYRYSWADNYYDWRPWYGYHSRHGRRDRDHYPTPRYGSARNEAERLSRVADGRYEASPRRVGGRDYGGGTAFDRYGASRDGARGADYRGRGAARELPETTAFGLPTRPGNAGAEVRRTGVTGPREFSVPVDGVRRGGRAADYGAAPEVERRYGPAAGEAMPRRSAPDSGYGARREVERYGQAPRGGMRGDEDGIAVPRQGMRTAPGYGGAGAVREYQREPLPMRDRSAADAGYRMPSREAYRPAAVESRAYAPAIEARSYPAPTRGYDAGDASPRYSAPPPRAEPRMESRPEPRFERPEPRYERPEPRYERQESRSGSRFDSGDGDRGVRRVGSNRDD